MSPVSPSWVDRSTPNLEISEDRHRRSYTWRRCAICCFVSKPQPLKGLLRFKTTAPQRPILHFLIPTVKITGGVGQISKSVFRAIIYAPVTCFTFPICCSISKLEHFKGDWCRKSRQNFALFDPSENSGVIGKMFEYHFVATPMT